MAKLVNVSLRLATKEDQHLDAYDNTKLQAINTCPTWGLIRYDQHKTYATNARAMALEAGSAMHEVFAAVRLWQLWQHTLKDNPLRDEFFEFHGKRLFRIDGESEEEQLSRWYNLKDLATSEFEDERTRCLNFCLAALSTSGFYDDPSDRRRTMSNLEEAALLYIDRYDMDRMSVWVRDHNDPTSDVGIEIAFDVVIEFEYDDGTVRRYRFIGKFDSVMVRDNDIVVGENKTASRLDTAWQESFEIASQVTGYCLVTSIFTQQSCERAIVYGLQIPLPKSLDLSGNIDVPVRRNNDHFRRWFAWFLHTVDIAEKYRGDILNAPMYTHSCNRYFRSCSLIPYCYGDDEDRQAHLNEMIIQQWSPLHSFEGKAQD